MRMSRCEITWGQDKESISCVSCCSALSYELVMITTLEHECELMSMLRWYNVNYEYENKILRICFMGILIYVILVDCALLMNEMQL